MRQESIMIHAYEIFILRNIYINAWNVDFVHTTLQISFSSFISNIFKVIPVYLSRTCSSYVDILYPIIMGS